MSTIKCVLVCCIYVLCMGTLDAQTASTDIRKYIPTENLDKKKENKSLKDMPKEKTYNYIYKESTEGILYGNPCALEETHRMGFEYVVEKETLPGSMLKSDTQWNNFLVNIKLIFTRSPFWKLILEKRLRQCRQKTGDIVG